MELAEFFKSYIETEDTPVVMCSLDRRIIYLNPCAASTYEKYGGYELVNKSLLPFIDEEAKSKVDMVVEWFKESQSNNCVFAFHDSSANKDVYIYALRDASGQLIGFCSKHRLRDTEKSEPYATN